MKRLILLFFTTLLITTLNAQHTDGNIFGDVQSEGKHIPYATVYLEGTTIGTTTDETGHYMLIDLPVGKYVIVAKSMGYSTSKQMVTIEANKSIEVNFVLEHESISLEQVVVTGTKPLKG
ncbi:MAG: carboxypeptidase-like regulatory domain-containing protein [Tenuifilaceae bacterium]|nr:carboxypeptidase-like regulatory domain-containing protein [Tenuifilaceae bacterium]